MQYDEEIVIKGLRNGCPKAYQAMVKRFTPAMTVMVHTFTNNQHDVEMLVTHTFEDAYLNIDKYEPIYRFSTWLFNIGKYNCIDYLRAKRITPWSETIEKAYIETKRNGKTPEELFICVQQAEMVRRAINQLKPGVRKYVIGFYLKEMSYAELEKKYKTKSSTIRTIIHRAKFTLKDVLTKYKML